MNRLVLTLLILAGLTNTSLSQEKYFHDLRGIEDSTGTTHLFYRVMDKVDRFEYTNHIYHFDVSLFSDSLFLKDETIEDDETGFNNFYTYDGVYSYSFFDNEVSKLIYTKNTHHSPPGEFLDLQFILNTNKTILDTGGGFFPKVWSPNLVFDRLVINRNNASDARSYIFISGYSPDFFIDYGFSTDTLSIISHHIMAQNPITKEFLTGSNDSLFILDEDLNQLYSVDYANFSKFSHDYPISDIYYDSDSSTIYLPHYSNNSTLRLSINENPQLDSIGIFNSIAPDPQFSGKVFVSLDSEIMYSLDYGENFQNLITLNKRVRGLYKKLGSNQLFVLLENEFVWVDIESLSVHSILDIPVSSEEYADNPSLITLYQNYPNPFNPSTVISFQLIGNSMVSLRVFDALGREVAVLVDELKSAGSHQVTFDAAGLASGVYYYVLNADEQILTKKLTLIK